MVAIPGGSAGAHAVGRGGLFQQCYEVAGGTPTGHYGDGRVAMVEHMTRYTEIPLPALSLLVLDSANAMPVNGSTTGEYTVSGSHNESTPARSSESTAPAN